MGKKMQRFMCVMLVGIILVFIHAYFVDKTFSFEQRSIRRLQNSFSTRDTYLNMNMHIRFSGDTNESNHPDMSSTQLENSFEKKVRNAIVVNNDRLENFVEKEGQFFIPTSISESASQDLLPKSMVRYASDLKGKNDTYVEKSRTCLQLVSAKDNVHLSTVRKVRKYMKVKRSRLMSDSAVYSMLLNCTKIRKFFQPYTTTVENDMATYPIAYSILLDKPAEQTVKLLRAVYSPFNIYCLHASENTPVKFRKLIRKLQSCVSNILLPKQTYSVVPQTVHRLYAETSCFRTLLNSTVPWKYIINMPGSVFPLKNNSIIVDYLKVKPYSNEMSTKIPESQRFFKRARYVHKLKKHGRRYVYLRTKALKSFPPHNLTLFRGDSTFVCTREFANFAVSSRIGKDLLEWAADTKNPEEFFWATLNRYPGSPGGLPYRKDDKTDKSIYKMDDTSIEQENISDLPESDLVATLWYSDKSHKCRGKYRGYQCTFASGDLRWLITQDKLFASPFDLKLDSIVLDCLYQHVRDPLVQDVVFKSSNDFL